MNNELTQVSSDEYIMLNDKGLLLTEVVINTYKIYNAVDSIYALYGCVFYKII